MIRRNRILLFSFIIAILSVWVSCAPTQSRVNQNKIERERAKNQKQARNEYDKAVTRHNNMQSKSTKASMKKTKKESAKTTPSKR